MYPILIYFITWPTNGSILQKCTLTNIYLIKKLSSWKKRIRKWTKSGSPSSRKQKPRSKSARTKRSKTWQRKRSKRQTNRSKKPRIQSPKTTSQITSKRNVQKRQLENIEKFVTLRAAEVQATISRQRRSAVLDRSNLVRDARPNRRVRRTMIVCRHDVEERGILVRDNYDKTFLAETTRSYVYLVIYLDAFWVVMTNNLQPTLKS